MQANFALLTFPKFDMMATFTYPKIKYITTTFIRSIGVFLGLLCALVIIQGLVALLAVVITHNVNSSDQLFLERLSPILAAGILIFWTKKRRTGIFNRIETAITINKKNIKQFTSYAIISLSIFYFFFIISINLGYSNFIKFGNKDFSVYSIGKQFILVGLLGNLFVAIGEEIIFRGFLLNYIKGISRNRLFGLLFTSFIFSLHHYPDFLNNVIAFLGGLAMGYAYLKFVTLYIPIGIHFSYNLFNASIASKTFLGPKHPYLIKFNYPEITDGFGAWVDILIIAAFIILLCFLWLKKVPVNNKKPDRADLMTVSDRP